MTIPLVQPGDPPRFAASDHNAMAEAANAYAAGRWGDRVPDRQRWRTGDLVRLQNTSGSDQAIGHVLKLATPAVGPSDDFAQFAGRLNILGDLPDGAACQFGVLVEPLQEQQTGWAAVSGAVAALVQITSQTHDFVCLERGSTILRSAAEGFTRILWRAGNTGLQWCYVLLLGGSCCAASSDSSSPSSSSSPPSSSPSSSPPSSASSPSSSSPLSSSPSSSSPSSPSSSSPASIGPCHCWLRCEAWGSWGLYWLIYTAGGSLPMTCGWAGCVDDYVNSCNAPYGEECSYAEENLIIQVGCVPK